MAIAHGVIKIMPRIKSADKCHPITGVAIANSSFRIGEKAINITVIPA
jgi:hypothetical protein